MHKLAYWLLIIGGLNWGLEALGTGLGSWIGEGAILTIIYALVGLSALYELFTHKNCCKTCGPKM